MQEVMAWSVRLRVRGSGESAGAGRPAGEEVEQANVDVLRWIHAGFCLYGCSVEPQYQLPD
jgi:hypothetical protein